MDTLQQRMAVDAHANVVDFGNAYPDDRTTRKKYGSMAHKLPILIHTAGLAQALAFVEARGALPQLQLLSDLAKTVAIAGIENRTQLSERSRTAPLAEYMLMTRRVLAALLWYKRFAESVLEVTQQDAAQDDAGRESDE